MATGMRNGSSEASQPGCGVLYFTSTLWASRTTRSASGRPPSRGPVVRNSLPLSSLPGDRPVGVVDLHGLHVAGADLGHEAGVGDLLGVAAAEEARQDHHQEGQPQEGPQAPLGHALVGPQGAAGATWAARGGRRRRGEALGHGPRIGADPLQKASGASADRAGRARLRVDAMSSRTCAKPSCNVSASATLTYDYGGQSVFLEHLNPEAHPMRYDLCTDHADASAGPAVGGSSRTSGTPLRATRSPPRPRPTLAR